MKKVINMKNFVNLFKISYQHEDCGYITTVWFWKKLGKRWIRIKSKKDYSQKSVDLLTEVAKDNSLMRAYDESYKDFKNRVKEKYIKDKK